MIKTITKVEELLTSILNYFTRAEKTQLNAPYLVNRYRHLNRSEKVRISSKPVFVDRVIVSKGGDQCKLILYDGNNEIFRGILNNEYLHKGKETEPYSIKISTEIQNELFAELYAPRASTHFKLNSISGTTIIDDGSNKTNGTGVNIDDTDWDNSGIVLNSLIFDGVNEYIVADVNDAIFNGTNPFSISMWIARTNTGTDYILAKYSGGKGILWQFTAGDQMWVRLIVAGTIIGIEHYTNLTSTLQHLVLTYDGSQKVEGLKLYLNRNEQRSTVSNTGTFTGDMSNTANMNIFINEALTLSTCIAGTLDDFRIYAEELSPEQVSLIYNYGVGTEEDFNVADVIITYKESILPTQNIGEIN